MEATIDKFPITRPDTAQGGTRGCYAWLAEAEANQCGYRVSAIGRAGTIAVTVGHLRLVVGISDSKHRRNMIKEILA